jgi:hypothetical protein
LWREPTGQKRSRLHHRRALPERQALLNTLPRITHVVLSGPGVLFLTVPFRHTRTSLRRKAIIRDKTTDRKDDFRRTIVSEKTANDPARENFPGNAPITRTGKDRMARLSKEGILHPPRIEPRDAAPIPVKTRTPVLPDAGQTQKKSLPSGETGHVSPGIQEENNATALLPGERKTGPSVALQRDSGKTFGETIPAPPEIPAKDNVPALSGKRKSVLPDTAITLPREETLGRTGRASPRIPKAGAAPALLSEERETGLSVALLRDSGKIFGETIPAPPEIPAKDNVPALSGKRKSVLPLIPPDRTGKGTSAMTIRANKTRGNRRHFEKNDGNSTKRKPVRLLPGVPLPDGLENLYPDPAVTRVPGKIIPINLNGAGHVSFPCHHGCHIPSDRIPRHARRMGTDRPGSWRSSFF